MKPSRNLIKRGMAVGLVGCILVSLPGGEAYGTLGEALKTGAGGSSGFSLKGKDTTEVLSESFLFYLKLQKISSEDYQKLPQDIQEVLKLQYQMFAKDAKVLLQKHGFLDDPHWRNKILDSKGELTHFGLWFAVVLEKHPDQKQVLAGLARKFAAKNPKFLKDPLGLHQATSELFDQAENLDEARAVETLTAFNERFAVPPNKAKNKAKQDTRYERRATSVYHNALRKQLYRVGVFDGRRFQENNFRVLPDGTKLALIVYGRTAAAIPYGILRIEPSGQEKRLPLPEPKIPSTTYNLQSTTSPKESWYEKPLKAIGIGIHGMWDVGLGVGAWAYGVTLTSTALVSERMGRPNTAVKLREEASRATFFARATWVSNPLNSKAQENPKAALLQSLEGEDKEAAEEAFGSKIEELRKEQIAKLYPNLASEYRDLLEPWLLSHPSTKEEEQAAYRFMGFDGVFYDLAYKSALAWEKGETKEAVGWGAALAGLSLGRFSTEAYAIGGGLGLGRLGLARTSLKLLPQTVGKSMAQAIVGAPGRVAEFGLLGVPFVMHLGREAMSLGAGAPQIIFDGEKTPTAERALFLERAIALGTLAVGVPIFMRLVRSGSNRVVSRGGVRVGGREKAVQEPLALERDSFETLKARLETRYGIRLRPLQEEGLRVIFADGKAQNVTIEAPGGGGKSLLAALTILGRSAKSRGLHVITTSRGDLVDQYFEGRVPGTKASPTPVQILEDHGLRVINGNRVVERSGFEGLARDLENADVVIWTRDLHEFAKSNRIIASKPTRLGLQRAIARIETEIADEVKDQITDQTSFEITKGLLAPVRWARALVADWRLARRAKALEKEFEALPKDSWSRGETSGLQIREEAIESLVKKGFRYTAIQEALEVYTTPKGREVWALQNKKITPISNGEADPNRHFPTPMQQAAMYVREGISPIFRIDRSNPLLATSVAQMIPGSHIIRIGLSATAFGAKRLLELGFGTRVVRLGKPSLVPVDWASFSSAEEALKTLEGKIAKSDSGVLIVDPRYGGELSLGLRSKLGERVREISPTTKTKELEAIKRDFDSQKLVVFVHPERVSGLDIPSMKMLILGNADYPTWDNLMKQLRMRGARQNGATAQAFFYATREQTQGFLSEVSRDPLLVRRIQEKTKAQKLPFDLKDFGSLADAQQIELAARIRGWLKLGESTMEKAYEILRKEFLIEPLDEIAIASEGYGPGQRLIRRLLREASSGKSRAARFHLKDQSSWKEPGDYVLEILTPLREEAISAFRALERNINLFPEATRGRIRGHLAQLEGLSLEQARTLKSKPENLPQAKNLTEVLNVVDRLVGEDVIGFLESKYYFDQNVFQRAVSRSSLAVSNWKTKFAPVLARVGLGVAGALAGLPLMILATTRTNNQRPTTNDEEDEIWLKEARQYDYFLARGFMSELYPGYMGGFFKAFKKLGLTAHSLRIKSYLPSDVNARVIRDRVMSNPRPVVLIGHSKGGLDIMEALRLYPEIKPRVARVVLVQTPVLGSPVADWYKGGGIRRSLAHGLLRVLGSEPRVLDELSVAYRTTHTHEWEPVIDDVPVFVVRTRMSPIKHGDPLSRLAWTISWWKDPRPGDGLIPFEAQRLDGARAELNLNGVTHLDTFAPEALWRKAVAFRSVNATALARKIIRWIWTVPLAILAMLGTGDLGAARQSLDLAALPLPALLFGFLTSSTSSPEASRLTLNASRSPKSRSPPFLSTINYQLSTLLKRLGFNSVIPINPKSQITDQKILEMARREAPQIDFQEALDRGRWQINEANWRRYRELDSHKYGEGLSAKFLTLAGISSAFDVFYPARVLAGLFIRLPYHLLDIFLSFWRTRLAYEFIHKQKDFLGDARRLQTAQAVFKDLASGQYNNPQTLKEKWSRFWEAREINNPRLARYILRPIVYPTVSFVLRRAWIAYLGIWAGGFASAFGFLPLDASLFDLPILKTIFAFSWNHPVPVFSPLIIGLAKSFTLGAAISSLILAGFLNFGRHVHRNYLRLRNQSLLAQLPRLRPLFVQGDLQGEVVERLIADRSLRDEEFLRELSQILPYVRFDNESLRNYYAAKLGTDTKKVSVPNFARRLVFGLQSAFKTLVEPDYWKANVTTMLGLLTLEGEIYAVVDYSFLLDSALWRVTGQKLPLFSSFALTIEGDRGQGFLKSFGGMIGWGYRILDFLGLTIPSAHAAERVGAAVQGLSPKGTVPNSGTAAPGAFPAAMPEELLRGAQANHDLAIQDLASAQARVAQAKRDLEALRGMQELYTTLETNYAASVYQKGRDKGAVGRVFKTKKNHDAAIGEMKFYKKQKGKYIEVTNLFEVSRLKAQGVFLEAYWGSRTDPDAQRVYYGAKAAEDDLREYEAYAKRKADELKTTRLLHDDSALSQAYEGEKALRDLASELAVVRTLAASLAQGAGGGDPVLAERLNRLVQIKAKVEAAIKAYGAKRARYEDLKAIYEQAVKIMQSEKSLQELAKSNAEMIQVVQLKFALKVLEVALEKLNELMGEVDQVLKENAKNSQEVEARRQWAADRQKIAETWLARAKKGEFVREVQDQIDKLNQTIAIVNQGQGDAQTFLSGGWGNLTAPFLDPEYIQEQEIGFWEDVKDQLDNQYHKARKFIDIDRNFTENEYDEFGDPHPVSIHMWIEVLRDELNISQASINQAIADFEALADLKKHPEQFYVGEKDGRRQATKEQKEALILRREGQALLRFGDAVIRYKVAESTLNALYNAYLKDPMLYQEFPGFPPEPFYNTTKEKIEQAQQQAKKQILPQINHGFEMERPLLLELGKNSGLDNAAIDRLIEMVNTQFQSDETGAAVPLGFAHRGYAVTDEGRRLAQESLDFYNYKLQVLNSNPSMSQLLQLAQNQLDLTQRQLAFAESKLSPFLTTYLLPGAQAQTQKWEGFVALYRDGYKMFFDAKAEFYRVEHDGFIQMKDFLQQFLGPVEIDYDYVTNALARLNPPEDPAIRRTGRALSQLGDEMLERLKKKQDLIRALEDLDRESLASQQGTLKATLEDYSVARLSLEEVLDRSDPDDPNRARALELLLEGNLFADESVVTTPKAQKQESHSIIRRSDLERLFMAGRLSGGRPPRVEDWISSLGFTDYEVFPVGSGPDGFYIVVHFSAGAALTNIADNFVEEAFVKFGNVGTMAGGQISVSLYDWKDLEMTSPTGVRGVRLTHERDKEKEPLVNTTVLDIHQMLQQGEVIRVMVFENLAFMFMKIGGQERVFVGLTGYGDFPTGQPKDSEDGVRSPYTLGGRAKTVIYLHEIVSLNGEYLRLFAKDPSEIVKEVNLSLDPLDPRYETIGVEGEILEYVKKHAGIEFDIGRLVTKKHRVALEFFMEQEQGTDYPEKTWKGGRAITEVHFRSLPLSIRAEGRAQWDQNNNVEPSGRLAFYLPKEIVVEGRLAQYGGKKTYKGALRAPVGFGGEVFTSYGNDTINRNPKLTVGIGWTMTSDQIRQRARAKSEEALKGGVTLEDFNEEVTKALGVLGEDKKPTTADRALGRVLNRDANIARLKLAIGHMEQEAVDLQRIFKFGVGVQGGYVLGTGYKYPQTGDSQSAYGYPSTAGGIQVSGNIWAGLTQQEKERAAVELMKMKMALWDLKKAHEDTIEEFRLYAFKYVLAKLRLAQIEELLAAPEIASNDLLKSRLRLERLKIQTELLEAQAALRQKAGLAKAEALPSEIETISIDTKNPEATLSALSRTLEFKDSWRNFLKKLAEINPKEKAKPNFIEHEFAKISPLRVLPFIEDITIDLGGTLWDNLGNSFAGIGGSVKIRIWDGERSDLIEAAITEERVQALLYEEKRKGEALKQDPNFIGFERWDLGKQKELLEKYLPVVKEGYEKATTVSQRLLELEAITETLRDLSRVYIEELSLPRVQGSPREKKKVSVDEVPELVSQAQKTSKTLQALALKREMASHMEEAGRRRWRLGVRLGVRWNPINNLWFETATQAFTTGGIGLFLPALDLSIKSKNISEKERELAQALDNTAQKDGELLELDIARQIAESYLRLLYSASIKEELMKQIVEVKKSGKTQEALDYSIQLLELRRLMERESLKLSLLVGLDPNQEILDAGSLDSLELEATTLKVKIWFENKMKGAPELERQALEARLKFIQALEGKIKLREKPRQISTEPIGFLFQLVGELFESLLAKDRGSSVSAPNYFQVVKMRRQLEMEYKTWEKTLRARQERLQTQNEGYAKSYEKEPTLAHRLEWDLSRLSLARLGSEKPLKEVSPVPFDRQRPYLGSIQSRFYLARDYMGPVPVDSLTGYITRDMLSDVAWKEGILEVMLSRPELIKQRYLVQAEVLDRYKEEQTRRLGEEVKNARLKGLLWKYRFLKSRWLEEKDETWRARISSLIEDTEKEMRIEFGKRPEDYPETADGLPADIETLKALSRIALEYVSGGAPLLGPLEAQLAEGRLQAQAVLENLKANAMNPSFVFGYLRGGYVAGLFVSPPTMGRTPGAQFFRDMESVFVGNLDSLLQARSLMDEARERLASNHVKAEVLALAIAQLSNYMGSLREEMAKNPGDIELLKKYHSAFEESLRAIAQLHSLYLNVETDLRLLGIKFPKTLGRSKREPWTKWRPKGTRGLSVSQALKWIRETKPQVLEDWKSMGTPQREERLGVWTKELGARLAKLDSDSKRRVEAMSDEIRRQGLAALPRKDAVVGVLVAIAQDSPGASSYQIAGILTRNDLEDLKADNRVVAYRSDSQGELIHKEREHDFSGSLRILVAPASFRGKAPQTLNEAARVGFMEFLASGSQIEERFQKAKEEEARSETQVAQERRYHETKDPFVLYTLSSQPGNSRRMLYEAQAVEDVKTGKLKLINTKTSQAIDPYTFSHRALWMRELTRLYVNGDYKFVDLTTGERIWTIEELWREGRLFLLEKDPIKDEWRRLDIEPNSPKANHRDIRAYVYFGPTPVMLMNVESEADLKEFESDLRELESSAVGDAYLTKKAQRDLEIAWQAGLVYLKTAFGFVLKSDGGIAKVFLSKDEFKKAKEKYSKSQLYLSQDLVLKLSSSGRIVEVQMRDLDDKLYARKLSQEPAVSEWKDWMAIEADSEFNVKRVFNADDIEDRTPYDWVLYVDREDNPNCPAGLCPIKNNRFPGYARPLGVVNPKDQTQVLFHSQKILEEIAETKGDLAKIQAKPWFYTLVFAGEITREFIMSPWELPISVGVGGANIAEKVAALKGEGIVHEDNNFLYDLANVAILWRVVPQIPDRINDPSGYPQTVAKKSAPWYTHIPIIGFFLGSQKDRLVVVDPHTNKPTDNFVELGQEAIERTFAQQQQNYENLRNTILARFQGGLSLRETTYPLGSSGYYPETHAQVVAGEASYLKVVEALESIGVKFAPDGTFAIEVVDYGSILEGSKIKGVAQARERATALKLQEANHKVWEKILSGYGGALRVVLEEGRIKTKVLEEGPASLGAWRSKVEQTLKQSPGSIYDPEIEAVIATGGQWLLKTNTFTLIFFDEKGNTKEVYQAILGPLTVKERFRAEEARYQLAKNYPTLLSVGGVVHVNSQGEATGFDIGEEALQSYLEAAFASLTGDKVLEAVQRGYVFDRSDGGKDIVVFPAQNVDSHIKNLKHNRELFRLYQKALKFGGVIEKDKRTGRIVSVKIGEVHQRPYLETLINSDSLEFASPANPNRLVVLVLNKEQEETYLRGFEDSLKEAEKNLGRAQAQMPRENIKTSRAPVSFLGILASVVVSLNELIFRAVLFA